MTRSYSQIIVKERSNKLHDLMTNKIQEAGLSPESIPHTTSPLPYPDSGSLRSTVPHQVLADPDRESAGDTR
jgi:hypothetical protein